MRKLLASAYKEIVLLSRDLGGIAILFIMPLVLVVTITLIQDSSFRTIQDNKIEILLVDFDKGIVAKHISEGLTASNSFEIISIPSETEAKEAVRQGKYQLAIVIPEKLSEKLQQKVANNVESVLAQFGVEEEPIPISEEKIEKKEIKLYFDPATQIAFKNAVKNGIDKLISHIEIHTIYQAVQEQMEEEDTAIFQPESFISYKEIVPTGGDEGKVPNSAQHNVPAWALFAIFFIIVPLSINIVKEKSQGTFVRLRTQPVNYATVLGGKTLVYVGVCAIQFTLLLLVGVFVFPSIGLPQLEVGGRLPLLYTVAIFSGLAAVGLGLLLGTVARTQEQSAPFGATLVVILAALGGVWVPVFVMPRFMQLLSNISPMNWGLNGFYDVFLRNATFTEILPEISLLLLFFIVTISISIV